MVRFLALVHVDQRRAVAVLDAVDDAVAGSGLSAADAVVFDRTETIRCDHVRLSRRVQNLLSGIQSHPPDCALFDVWLSAEMLNMFGINNTVSYLWVRDFQNSIYAVPNNLTARLFNVRLEVDF